MAMRYHSATPPDAHERVDEFEHATSERAKFYQNPDQQGYFPQDSNDNLHGVDPRTLIGMLKKLVSTPATHEL